MNISIVAYNRPKYLYVTLDALSRVSGIERCPVNVYFDGGLSPEERSEAEAVIGGFSISKTVFQKKNIGNLDNETYAISDQIDNGAKEVLFFEEDMILHPESIGYLDSIEDRTAMFISLCSFASTHLSIYCPLGNRINAQDFSPLRRWIENRNYVGVEDPLRHSIIDRKTKGHDHVFFTYVHQRNLLSRFANKGYVLHFGVVGMNHRHPDSETLLIEEEMFSGERSTWLPRIIQIAQRTDLPISVKKRLIPENFDFPGLTYS